MRRVLAVVAGIVSGVLLAGVLTPVFVTMAPLRLRAATFWIVTALAVALAIWALWAVSRAHRD